MTSKEEEYREIFLTEALESYTEINRLLTVLEKSPSDSKTIQALFRMTHTLKGNATGMGYEKIAEMAHVTEDLFGAVRDGKITITAEMFNSLFKAADVLGELISAVKEPKDVKYRGIKTKLEVMLKTALAGGSETPPQPPSSSEAKPPVANQVADTKSAPVTVEEKEEVADEPETKVAFSDLVQVPVQKLDNLLNLVGELVIERDRMIASSNGVSTNEFARLNRISSDLQYSVMDVRLVQVGFLFNKFHRIVRDVASKEGKMATLQLEGTETEIDRNILQVISDSLIHLIRNSVGHGVEKPEDRKRLGKPEAGTITLEANSESDNVIIKIKDDGAGIDPAKIRKKAIEKKLITPEESAKMSDQDAMLLIFEAGFSTMDNVTAISGRGVGMDVVKKALDSIGGNIQMESVIGKGTTFSMNLPSSMAVKSTLLFELNKETFAIPLAYTESVISTQKSSIHKTPNGLVTVHLDQTTPLIFLSDLFQYGKKGDQTFESAFDAMPADAKLEIVVVTFSGKRLGLVVDKLYQQKEIIEKPLTKPVDGGTFVSGVTILGNGNVCLVLSIPGIITSSSLHQFNK
jgi:two-component system, chemotaxis family, sensor kinase CheA